MNTLQPPAASPNYKKKQPSSNYHRARSVSEHNKKARQSKLEASMLTCAAAVKTRPDDLLELRMQIQTEMQGKKAILDHNAIYATLFMTITLPMFSADNAVHYADLVWWRQYMVLFGGCGSALSHIICIFMAVEFNFVFSVLNSIELELDEGPVELLSPPAPASASPTKKFRMGKLGKGKRSTGVGGAARRVRNRRGSNTLTYIDQGHEERKMTALLHLKKHPLLISKLGISGHCLFIGIVLSVLSLLAPMAEWFDYYAGDAALCTMVFLTICMYVYGIVGIGRYVKTLVDKTKMKSVIETLSVDAGEHDDDDDDDDDEMSLPMPSPNSPMPPTPTFGIEEPPALF